MGKIVSALLLAAALAYGPSSAFAERSPGAEKCARLVVAEPATADQQLVVAQGCCKVCRKGKACGDSCISRTKNCTKGPGCACDG